MKSITLLAVVALLACSCADEQKSLPQYFDTSVASPTVFAPGIISTENNEFDMCFTPDGKTIYFTRRKNGEKQRIYRTDLVNGSWTTPKLAPFSTDRDETPFITPDGQTFYFGSQRQIPGKPNLGGFDMNVWKMTKEGDGWSDPVPLPEPINYVQVEGEHWPSSNNNYLFTLDGKTHYFTTQVRGTEGIDVFTTQLENGIFNDPEKIEGLFTNDSLWKYSASVSPDGRFLVFNVYDGPKGLGGDDIYVSQKTNDGWSPARNLGSPVNTEGEEGSARFSLDGRYFFYTHADNLGNEEYSPWSIYCIETKYLNLESLFE